MKLKFTLFVTAVVIVLSALSAAVHAQAVSPFSTPSDTTTAPPANASAVGKVLCAGGQVSLKGQSPVVSTNKYQWFKVTLSGTKQLVKEATGDNTYIETTNGAGYYTYELVESNDLNCSSPASNPIQVYVLPTLAPTITGNGSVCEQGKSTSDLTIQGLNTSKYSYTYQWTRNGSPIPAADGGTADHYTVKEQATGTVTFGVTVAYSLNSGCSASAPTKSVTVITVPGKPSIQIN